MSSENDKAAAASLILNVRATLKDALFDLEAALEDHEDAKTITDRLILEYGLEPFILSTGQLGIHFMELSYSIEGETLIEQLRDEIDACRNPDGEIGEDERTDLMTWRNTLAEAIAEIDAALKSLR
jgi:hypothetical protein